MKSPDDGKGTDAKPRTRAQDLAQPRTFRHEHPQKEEPGNEPASKNENDPYGWEEIIQQIGKEEQMRTTTNLKGKQKGLLKPETRQTEKE